MATRFVAIKPQATRLCVQQDRVAFRATPKMAKCIFTTDRIQDLYGGCRGGATAVVCDYIVLTHINYCLWYIGNFSIVCYNSQSLPRVSPLLLIKL